MRKKEVITVPASGGRDDGKLFTITEMSAMQAEKWAWRLMIALKGSRGWVPDEVAQLGMVGVTVRMINAFLSADVDYPAFEALLDEMMECVRRVRDPRRPDVEAALNALDIEEVSTVAWLRSEVIRVHTGFSVAAGLTGLISAVTASAASSSTQTSPRSSEPRSQPAPS
jgi:hypothetical protein